MGMKDWYMDRMMNKMSPDEKKGMMNAMMDKFFESMTGKEKKEMMNTMMPKMMDKMFEGMSGEDKLGLMGMMMPRMMAQMFGGREGEAKAMMPVPACGPGTEDGRAAPGLNADFRPWECCPCRNYCVEGRRDDKRQPVVSSH